MQIINLEMSKHEYSLIERGLFALLEKNPDKNEQIQIFRLLDLIKAEYRRQTERTKPSNP